MLRFHDAPTKGYEDDVGSKFTLWCSDLWCRTGYPNVDQSVIKTLYTCSPGDYWKARQRKWWQGEVIEMPDSYLRHLCVAIPHPTTGMRLLWWLYCLRGPISRDSVFGFDFYETQPYRYYDHKRGLTKKHDPVSERCLFEKIVVDTPPHTSSHGASPSG